MHIRRPSRHVLGFLEMLSETSYTKLLSLWFGIVVTFAAMYIALSYLPGYQSLTQLHAQPLQNRIGNSLYFSIITSTTVGYGDLTPQGFAKFFASIQAVFAYFVFVIFVTKLVSYKSEVATHEMHTLMFENKFHLTREGFFTIRKDFDMVIRDITERDALADDDWDKLAIAYWEGQRLLEGTLNFYSSNDQLFMLDTKRERLLIETVHRTLERLLKMLQELDHKHINWRHHERNRAELLEFLTATEHAEHHWRQASVHHNKDWFDRLAHVLQALRKQVG